ncbi:LysO family transporter [Thermodesulforhabdus norvegica]|uniref:DUF340 domain-containing protein n=1 Tax=Thermodesulforhabdus norvegica TaxID=39841 RepID=A0A1I4QUS4_9BACT|nr:LysO family transporter [Thermodesulforhabdus norvegica]SFM43789.1 Membrane protein of unknown function [Thermodesulforhabdus norvegica]
MLYLFIAVLVGIFLGLLPSMPEGFYRAGQKILNFGLFILLFFMGVRLGSYPDVVGQLGLIGIRAALFALVTLVGSVLVVWMIERFILKRREPDK